MSSVFPISAGLLRQVVHEIAGPLQETRLENAYEAPERTLVLVFRGRGEKLSLLLSAEPRFARLHLVARRAEPPREPPPFCAALRRLFRGKQLRELRQVEGDRLVELEFVNAAAGDPAGYLVQELFGRRPNILLLDPERRLIAGLDVPRRQGQQLRPGSPYGLPTRAPRGEEPSGALEGASGARFPLSASLEARHAVESEEARLEEGRGRLAADLRRERKRREIALGKVESDIERASARRREREVGELLKGAFGNLRQGLSSIEVVDYYSPDMPLRRIELDPALGPRENVERYFQRARKAERAVKILGERMENLRAEAERLRSLEDRLAQVTDTESLASLESEASRLVRRRRGGVRASSRRPRGRADLPGVRRFVSADGYEILVGRSARDNDRLTLHLARGNDIFLHVAGRPGAHVVIRARPGVEVPPGTLRDAAQLALYYSLPHRSGGVLAEGARADVDYTRVKNVRKPRGARPGAVLLATHKSLRTELDRERLEDLRSRRTDVDPAGGP